MAPPFVGLPAGELRRPGPYDPEIDDGVKANIRPFPEAGLLAVKEVIKKW